LAGKLLLGLFLFRRGWPILHHFGLLSSARVLVWLPILAWLHPRLLLVLLVLLLAKRRPRRGRHIAPWGGILIAGLLSPRLIRLIGPVRLDSPGSIPAPLLVRPSGPILVLRLQLAVSLLDCLLIRADLVQSVHDEPLDAVQTLATGHLAAGKVYH